MTYKLTPTPIKQTIKRTGKVRLGEYICLTEDQFLSIAASKNQ